MKLLNITVGGNIHHVIDFDDKSFTRTFILDNINNERILFRLATDIINDRPQYFVQTEKGRHSIDLINIKEDVTINNGNLYSATKELVFIENNFNEKRASKESIDEFLKNNGYNTFNEEVRNEHCHADGNFFREALSTNEITEFTIKFVVIVNDLTRKGEGEFKIIMAPHKNIYQSAIDFGSEASQAILYNNDNAGKPVSRDDILYLFNDISVTFGADANIDKENHNSEKNQEYLQHDPDPRLYRSLFFAKKKFEDDDSFEPSNPLKRNDNEHLIILKKENEIDDDFKKTFFTLPNIKIATLGGSCPNVIYKKHKLNAADFKDGFFYRTAINSFIYQILKNIVFKQEQESVKGPVYLRLTVLMPNVYSQGQLSKKIKDINEDIHKMLEKDEFHDCIRDVEVNSISESDASFLGYMYATTDLNAQENLKGGNYLIIDAGKGTMDLSVLSVNPDTTPVYTSLYRTGIVGAGNAISYAVFLDLVYHQLGKKGLPVNKKIEAINAIVRNLVINGDEGHLETIMKYVERFKKLWGEKNWPDKDVSPTDNETTFTIVPMTDPKCVKIISEKKEEESTPEEIIDLEKIKSWIISYFDEDYSSSKPATAILKKETGVPMIQTKAMIHNLIEELMNKLETFNQRIDYIVLSGRAFYLKPFREELIKSLKKNKKWRDANQIDLTSLANRGINSKNLCLFVNNMLYKNNHYDGRVVGRPNHRKFGVDPFIEKHIPSKSASRIETKVSKWEKLTNLPIFHLFGDYHSPAPMSEEDYVQGIQIKISHRWDKITIGGTYYDLPDGKKGDKAAIYFNGDHFLFVCKNSVSPFSPAVLRIANHTFESTFPYGIIDSDIIPFPYTYEETPTTGTHEETPETYEETPDTETHEETPDSETHEELDTIDLL